MQENTVENNLTIWLFGFLREPVWKTRNPAGGKAWVTERKKEVQKVEVSFSVMKRV